MKERTAGRIRSLMSYLVIVIMAFMIIITGLFIYTSIHLRDKIIYHTVEQTELAAEIITRASSNIMKSGHGREQYEMLLDYGNMVGINDIGIYRTTGEEAFTGLSQTPRRITRGEAESFKKAIAMMNSTGYFDREKMAYSRYAPIVIDKTCLKCHSDRVLGVLAIKLSTGKDFELLEQVQDLIWTLGLIVCLPIGALVIAGAIIREKNRLYNQLEESNSILTRTNRELNETEYYLQMILDNSRVIMITTDIHGNIVEFNKEAERLLEYSKEDIVGKDVLMLYHNPVQRSETMKGAGPVGDEIWEVRNREVMMKSRTGKVYHVSLTLSTMVNDKGKIIGTVGVGKDISEQKMLQFKLLQSEKLAGIGTLASGIAHEINNPLAGILGMAEAIRDEEDVPLIKSYTQDIIEYTEHAKNIVKELSAYSRAVNDETKSIVDLSEALDHALKMAKHASSFKGIEVRTELEPYCLINANQVEMQQVFVNLIINAVHAMGDRGTLTIKCWQEGSFVCAKVSDTGHGIPEESLSQIYDPFFTTKPAGMGTGLGLYVVYRLVTRYKGSIDVESRVGEGTTFFLKFPEAAAAIEESPAASQGGAQ